MSVAAAKVLAELSFAVAQGMHDAVLADPQGRRYVLSPDARDYWLKGHARSVPKALKERKSWKSDRPGVLLMATLLGKSAVQLAHTAAGAAPGLVHVTKAMAERATKTVRLDARCVAFKRRNKLGGGLYCDF